MNRIIFLLIIAVFILFSCEEENFKIENSGLHNGLVAYYPFDGDAKDESNNKNHGTIIGASFTPDRFGNSNYTINLDGNKDWVICGTDNRGITNTITISLWLKTWDALCIVISKYDLYVGGTPGFFICLDTDGYLRLYGRNELKGDFIRVPKSFNTINDSKWHHVIAVINSNQWEVWIDGVLEGTTSTSASNPLLKNSKDLVIGNCFHPTSSAFHEFCGRIDDVAIYNRVLTPDEMTTIRLYGIK